jgi:hypothetical protein
MSDTRTAVICAKEERADGCFLHLSFDEEISVVRVAVTLEVLRGVTFTTALEIPSSLDLTDAKATLEFEWRW